MGRLTILLLLTLLASAPAGATGEVEGLITDRDRERLTDYRRTREEALREARASGDPKDVTTLDAVLGAAPLSWEGFDMRGDWRCRTIKAGGTSPQLVIYDWFRCRVSDDGAGWLLEKTSGSQRTRGRFFDDGGRRLIYLGSFFIAGEKAPPYGSGSDSDQVGYAFRTAADAFRLELPQPPFESKLDVLELRR